MIGTSKHKDYWEYHYRQGDLRSLRDAGLTKFVRVDEKHDIESVISAVGLRDKTVKDSALPKDSLTDAELAEVSGAVELVRGGHAAQPVKAASDGERAAAEAASVGGTANRSGGSGEAKVVGERAGTGTGTDEANGGAGASVAQASTKPSRPKSKKR